MKNILAMILLLSATQSFASGKSQYQPTACEEKVKTAAVEYFLKEFGIRDGQPRAKIKQMYQTEMTANNYITAHVVVTLDYMQKIQAKYVVYARQIGASDDCNVMKVEIPAEEFAPTK